MQLVEIVNHEPVESRTYAALPIPSKDFDSLVVRAEANNLHVRVVDLGLYFPGTDTVEGLETFAAAVRVIALQRCIERSALIGSLTDAV